MDRVRGPEQVQGTVDTTRQPARIYLNLYNRYIQKLSEILGWQFVAAGGPTWTNEDINQCNLACYCYYMSGLRGQQDLRKLKVAHIQMLQYLYHYSFIH